MHFTLYRTQGADSRTQNQMQNGASKFIQHILEQALFFSPFLTNYVFKKCLGVGVMSSASPLNDSQAYKIKNNTNESIPLKKSSFIDLTES